MNRLIKSAASALFAMSTLALLSCEDDSDIIGLNDAAKYGYIKVTLAGEDPNGEDFEVTRNFKFAPSGAPENSSSVYTYDDDGYYQEFDVRRFLGPINGGDNDYADLYLYHENTTPDFESAQLYIQTVITTKDKQFWKEQRLYSFKNSERNTVIILGTGSMAVNLVKELAHSPDWQVVGRMGDSPKKQGSRLHGIRVLGKINKLDYWVEKLSVRHVIIAMPPAMVNERRQALEIWSEIGEKAKTIPSYADLVSGKMTVSQIRDIELDDLLGREPVVLDTDGLHALLSDKTILITGAGGSIGSELCRQIITFKPKQLILFELNEFALYSIQEEFCSKFPDTAMAFVIGDVKVSNSANRTS